MTQQAPQQTTVREEERTLGITYERALAIVPALLEKAGTVSTLGDGYFVVASSGTQRRELTVRLGRSGADTRISLRAESFTDPSMTALVIVVAMVTMGLGVLVMLPWFMSAQRKESRERDLLVHRTLRSIEDAVAEQGVAPNYRVAPGMDAVVAGPEALEEEAAPVSGAGAATRHR